MAELLITNDGPLLVVNKDRLLEEAFPVGAVYLNATGVDPATELGYGTWVQVAQGQFLVGEV